MPLTYSVSIQGFENLQGAFQRAPQLVEQQLSGAIDKALVDLQRTAKQLAPVDTGLLRNSIQITPAHQVDGGFEGDVHTGSMAYAVYMEQGTGIYGPRQTPITPKNGPYLQFKTKDGHWVRTKQVKGTPGKFYMKGAVEQNQARIAGYGQQAADAIAEGLAQ